MAMQYPLLFPYDEDFYRNDVKYQNLNGPSTSAVKRKKRERVTLRDTMAFRLQQRFAEGQTLIRGGRLFQQFIVDGWTALEDEKLGWVRRNQKTLRAELYCGLRDTVVRGDTTPASLGRRFVLPSSHTGGPRYMAEYYQDAMAICRHFGTPDIFITFTCNPKWIEIQKFLDLIPGQKPED